MSDIETDRKLAGLPAHSDLYILVKGSCGEMACLFSSSLDKLSYLTSRSKGDSTVLPQQALTSCLYEC